MARNTVVKTKPQTTDQRRGRRRTKRTAAKASYTISDGDLVLILEPCEEGGYCVTSPFDPGLVTQGETLEECFEMARDAAQLLRECREDLSRETRPAARAKQKRR